MVFLKCLRKSIENIKNKILLFAPFTLVVFLAIYILIFYSIMPFQNEYFQNYIIAYLIYYIAIGGLVSIFYFIKKKVFSSTLYAFTLIGQIKAFNEEWQQYINQQPTMGPIVTFYTFIAFGFLIGLCFEGVNSIRKNI